MTSANGTPRRNHSSTELSAAALFTLLWNALADLLGTAASAVLLRRATQRAARRHPELAELIIVRQSLEYRYTLPSTWDEATGGTQCALHHLVGELVPLLNDLTGPVAVQHLAQIRELQEWGIVAPQEEGS